MGIPDLFWLGALLVALGGVVLLRFGWRRTRLAQRRCPQCGYDLRGTPGLRCSECGFEASDEKRLWLGRRRWWLASVGVIVILGSSGIGLIPTFRSGRWISSLPTLVLLQRELSSDKRTFSFIPLSLNRDGREFLRRRKDGVWLFDHQHRALMKNLGLISHRDRWVRGEPFPIRFRPFSSLYSYSARPADSNEPHYVGQPSNAYSECAVSEAFFTGQNTIWISPQTPDSQRYVLDLIAYQTRGMAGFDFAAAKQQPRIVAHFQYTARVTLVDDVDELITPLSQVPDESIQINDLSLRLCSLSHGDWMICLTLDDVYKKWSRGKVGLGAKLTIKHHDMIVDGLNLTMVDWLCVQQDVPEFWEHVLKPMFSNQSEEAFAWKDNSLYFHNDLIPAIADEYTFTVQGDPIVSLSDPNANVYWDGEFQLTGRQLIQSGLNEIRINGNISSPDEDYQRIIQSYSRE